MMPQAVLWGPSSLSYVDSSSRELEQFSYIEISISVAREQKQNLQTLLELGAEGWCYSCPILLVKIRVIQRDQIKGEMHSLLNGRKSLVP